MNIFDDRSTLSPPEPASAMGNTPIGQSHSTLDEHRQDLTKDQLTRYGGDAPLLGMQELLSPDIESMLKADSPGSPGSPGLASKMK